jgi:hypothetical protein
MKQTKPFSTFITMIFRTYSFQSITQFSQGDNVQDATASNMDGFLLRDICVSSTNLSIPIGSKKSLSPP